MKLFKLVSCVIIGLSLTSCSNEKYSGDDNLQQDFKGVFMPSSLNNEWNYDVNNTNNETNETNLSEDIIKVDNESSTGFSLIANNGELANSIMSRILTSGKLSLTNTTLTSHGNITLPINGFDVNIPLDNLILYNTQAAINEEISTQTNTITQEIQGFPITINYTLSSRHLGNLEHYTVTDTNYQIVTSSKITLEASIQTQITVLGFVQTINIIDNQEILSVDSFYAKNIGLVSSLANISYILNSNAVSLLNQTGLDIPVSSSITNTSALTSYNLQ